MTHIENVRNALLNIDHEEVERANRIKAQEKEYFSYFPRAYKLCWHKYVYVGDVDEYSNVRVCVKCGRVWCKLYGEYRMLEPSIFYCSKKFDKLISESDKDLEQGIREVNEYLRGSKYESI